MLNVENDGCLTTIVKDRPAGDGDFNVVWFALCRTKVYIYMKQRVSERTNTKAR